MRNLSDQEKRQRAEKAAKKMDRARRALEADEAHEAYQQFMERFAICEVGYKCLLADHLSDLGRTVKPGHLKIDTPQAKTVLKRASIPIHDDTFKAIFDGTKDIGKRNARGLRNSLAHRPNQEALDELIAKLPEFNKAMDAFEMAIKTAASREGENE